jgi:benzoate-CoA ligase
MGGAENLATRLLADPVAAGDADRVALREGERAWTVGQLADTAARLATAFRTLRLGRGDRIAIYMRDSLEAAASLLGCAYAGAVAVPISELATANDVRDILNDCSAAAAIVHGALEPALDEIRNEVPSLREVVVLAGASPGERDWNSLVRGSSPAAAPVPVAATDAAFILYSAGAGTADGGVRGVPHTHETPIRAFESIQSGVAPMSREDRVFSIVRLSTAYGLGFGLLFPLAAGAEATLLSKQPKTRAVLETLVASRPTMFAATPSVFRQLATDVEAAGGDRPLEGIACVSGAEDMPASVIDKVEDVLGADVVVGYGLTEAFQFVIAGRAADGRAGACGRPLDGFDLRIVNDNGVEVGTDVIGTLQIRGPTVAAGYWGSAGPATDADGWFTTRDRFMRDADGFYYHCGRVDHLFKVGGKWVAPHEVERALLGHEAVWECAVIGADDEDGLIKPLAFIVANIGHEPGPALDATLRAYVKNELAPYKYPRWIEFVDALPKGPNGKVLRYKLREAIRGGSRGRRAETASPS